MIPIQQILVRCTEEQLESILSSCQTIMSHMEFVTGYTSLQLAGDNEQYWKIYGLNCLVFTEPCSPRSGQNKAQSEPADEVNWEGQPSFFHDGAQVLPDDGHPYLLYDCRRSIYFDYQVLGVPSIALQVILSRAYVGRALQGFTSSALLHNTVALPIPNVFEKNCIFNEFCLQNSFFF